MIDTAWQRIDTRLRMAVPVAFAVAFALLSTAPLGVPHLGPAMPFLPALAVFHWTVYRPDLMPRAAVFAVGLLHDGLTGAPLGLSALALLLMQAAAARARPLFAERAMPALWCGFALCAALASALSWIGGSIYLMAPLPIEAALAQLGLTVACYPFAAALFAAFQRDILYPAVARAP